MRRKLFFPLLITVVFLTSWIIFTRISPTNWSSIVTFSAVISAWLIPFALDYCRNKKRRKAIEASVALYLDSLEIKLNIEIDRCRKVSGVILQGRNFFESQNKKNHDAIEYFFRSEYLEANEREELMKLIRYFKISAGMKKEEDFKNYLNKLKEPSLRNHFPRAIDLDSKIEEAIQNT